MSLAPRFFRSLALAALFAACAARSAVADVGLAATSRIVPPGGVVSVPVAFTGVSDAPTTVLLQLTFDPALVTPLGGDISGPNAAGIKFLDWNVIDTTLYLVAFCTTGSFTTQDALSLYFHVATGAPTASIAVAFAGGDASSQVPDQLAVNFAGLNIAVAPQSGFHTADVDGSWSITLTELLRAIQFYNFGAFHCEAGTEDGFAPGPGDTTCAPHDSDYAPQDWIINLSELLRLIQIYNSLGNSYHPDATGEDGFGAGPF